ncbi:dihydrofolate reductase [Bacillus cereus]|nr:dihydrofolate reductase [Bacillus cereus]
MIISFMVAMDENKVIGKDNKLPWHLPSELQYVKKTTMGHPLIMGRKNYEAIGRPLPGRRNIIVTRNMNYHVEGCEIAQSVEEVFELCKNEEEIFIFGGAQIYELFLPYVNKLYITKIHHSFEGDTFFPEMNMKEWKEVFVEKGVTDEKNPYTYYYHIYEKQQ